MKRYIYCSYIGETYRGFKLYLEDKPPQRYYIRISDGKYIYENSVKDLKGQIDFLLDTKVTDKTFSVVYINTDRTPYRVDNVVAKDAISARKIVEREQRRTNPNFLRVIDSFE